MRPAICNYRGCTETAKGYCPEHLRHYREYYADLRDGGVCVRCKKAWSRKGYTTCFKCGVNEAQRIARYRERRKTMLNENQWGVLSAKRVLAESVTYDEAWNLCTAMQGDESATVVTMDVIE